MTLLQLEYALALAKYGSFKNAAEKLSISQPGLSIQIQKLEDSVGLILFDRSKSPIQATTDGKEFLKRAEEIVVSSKKLTSFAQDLGTGFQGKLSVGIIPTLAPFLVPLFIDNLLRDYPDFELQIEEQITVEIIKNVRNGDLDVGIISTPIDVHGIRSEPLFYERFFFYTASIDDAHNISLSNIDYSNLWILNEGNCFRDQINDFCNIKPFEIGRQLHYKSNSIDALIRIVDTKGGLTILPELTTLSLNEVQEEKITKIDRKAREIGMIMRCNPDKERFISKLKEYIQKNIPNHLLRKKDLEIVNPGIDPSS